MAGTINNNRPTTETSRTFYIPETTRLTSVLDRLCSILSLYLHSQWIVVVVVKSMTDRDELITQRGKWMFYCYHVSTLFCQVFFKCRTEAPCTSTVVWFCAFSPAFTLRPIRCFCFGDGGKSPWGLPQPFTKKLVKIQKGKVLFTSLEGS